jgi:hypothetical protein
VTWHGFAVGLVTGHGSEEMRAAVGRRLAGGDRQSRLVLGGDEEDSPLQESKRSSMSLFLIIINKREKEKSLINSIVTRVEATQKLTLG